MPALCCLVPFLPLPCLTLTGDIFANTQYCSLLPSGFAAVPVGAVVTVTDRYLRTL